MSYKKRTYIKERTEYKKAKENAIKMLTEIEKALKEHTWQYCASTDIMKHYESQIREINDQLWGTGEYASIANGEL